MYCEKYRATISEKTCILRQGGVKRQGAISGRGWQGWGDPGCRRCSQGIHIRKTYKEEKPMEETKTTTETKPVKDMKTCGKCGETKPIGCFRPYAGTSDGLAGTCRQCGRKADKTVRMKTGKVVVDINGPWETIEPRICVTIDFTDNQNVLKMVENAAMEEIRTLEQQIIFCLKTMCQGVQTTTVKVEA